MPDILLEGEKMACDLESECNFLYGFFTCNLPEDTIVKLVPHFIYTIRNNNIISKVYYTLYKYYVD